VEIKASPGVTADARAAAAPEYVGAGETARAFALALLGGDAATAASYFSPAAQLVTPDGTELTGRASIGELLAQLTSPDQQLEIRMGRTLRADSVALCTQYWRRCAKYSPAESFEAVSTARLVLARAERRWQILIAAPWG
jgi:ketosteroid isomerase-like protein